jgi:hypothetical protein
MNRSEVQRAENEATFRRANENLARKAGELDLDEQATPYLCECADRGCTEVLMLTRSQYEHVRSDPRRFVVVPGHAEPEDRLVDEQAGFHLIEKTGEEGRIVEERDPRSRP